MLIAILAIYTKGVPLDIQGHFKFGSSYFFTRQLGEDYFFFKKLPRPPDIKWCAPITHDKTVLLINQSMTYQTVRDLQHVPRDVLIQFHILPNCRYFLQNQRQIAKWAMKALAIPCNAMHDVRTFYITLPPAIHFIIDWLDHKTFTINCNLLWKPIVTELPINSYNCSFDLLMWLVLNHRTRI